MKKQGNHQYQKGKFNRFLTYEIIFYYRYFHKKYSDDRKQTLGVECHEKTKFINDKKYQIKVWDTAGQEKFAVMAKSYYQRAHGIIVACALNNRNTFYNLKNWLNSIKDNTDADTIQLIILANKSDLIDEREVETSELADKAKELGIEYFETSAKENVGIDDAMNKIVDKVFNAVYNKERGISLKPQNNSNSNGSNRRCC